MSDSDILFYTLLVSVALAIGGFLGWLLSQWRSRQDRQQQQVNQAVDAKIGVIIGDAFRNLRQLEQDIERQLGTAKTDVEEILREVRRVEAEIQKLADRAEAEVEEITDARDSLEQYRQLRDGAIDAFRAAGAEIPVVSQAAVQAERGTFEARFKGEHGTNEPAIVDILLLGPGAKVARVTGRAINMKALQDRQEYRRAFIVVDRPLHRDEAPDVAGVEFVTLDGIPEAVQRYKHEWLIP